MNNIGDKLKGLAVLVICIGVILAVLFGLNYIRDSILTTILVIAGGILSTLILGFALYGLGQIVDNTDVIAEHYRRVNKIESKQDFQDEVERIKAEITEARRKLYSESVPLDAGIDVTCPECGASLTYTKGELLNDAELKCPECGGKVDVLRR